MKKEEGLLYECQAFVPTEEPDANETRGHFSAMSQFLRDIQEGIPAETRSVDNIQSLAMVLGAIESATQARRVQVLV